MICVEFSVKALKKTPTYSFGIIYEKQQTHGAKRNADKNSTIVLE